MTTKNRKPDEQCQIIQFSTARLTTRQRDEITANTRAIVEWAKQMEETSASDYVTARKARRDARLLTPAATETGNNHRLRQARRDAWRDAERITHYWRARLEWNSALSSAQSWDVADANSYPKCDEDRLDLVDLWRVSLVKQMLTPAPDVTAVNWKRAQFRAENFLYTNVKPERLQRAIDADVEWLAAHPSKKSKPMTTEAKEQRRNFKDAMRQRIKDIAASRDIPDDEIRRVLSLRHHHIAKFVTTYNVSLDWLLEGRGPIFKAPT
jgi:hypothetical protein